MSIEHFLDVIGWLWSDAMNNHTAFAKAPDEWTQIEHNMCGRWAAQRSPLWWRPCLLMFQILHVIMVDEHEPFVCTETGCTQVVRGFLFTFEQDFQIVQWKLDQMWWQMKTMSLEMLFVNALAIGPSRRSNQVFKSSIQNGGGWAAREADWSTNDAR